MKRFKVKIKCPMFFKDTTEITRENGLIRMPFSHMDIDPLNYPEIFEEIKEPLFVTEDGKELFDKNDKVFPVKIEDFTKCSVYYLSSCDLNFMKSTEEYKYLSSDKAAEKWIDENKPVFSKKQIRDIINKYYISEDLSAILAGYVYYGSLYKELGL